ncbi:leucine-rich repeat domain-containing protein [Skeletonema marinoi]|uniref:Leucine-rich repeat domain-containing protein n=1 Tax=Skeletonema marinoi TaxID=267567 RepID=A0AAD9D6I5_9STRA|nr:leucine-rich repeat domain-containing protein [Skeletonema marinoi]
MFVYTGGRVPEHLRLHITHARVDESVTEIDDEAFARCHRLLDVDCHNGVERVNERAFYLCRSLRRANLPGVTFIDQSAFGYCSRLMDVKFSSRLETIETWAFDECEDLKYLKIPSLLRIKFGAFFSCKTLAEAEFGEGLETIGVGAFQYCHSLRRIAIPLKYDLFTLNSNERYDQFDDCFKLATVELVGSIHKTISFLSLQNWRNEMNQEISRINEVLPNLSTFEKAGEMRDWIRRVLRRIEHYKAEHSNLLKEAMVLLELAVWKAKLRQNEEEKHSVLDSNKAKKIKLDLESARHGHRVTCGADIIIKNVLPFLELPKGDDDS